MTIPTTDEQAAVRARLTTLAPYAFDHLAQPSRFTQAQAIPAVLAVLANAAVLQVARTRDVPVDVAVIEVVRRFPRALTTDSFDEVHKASQLVVAASLDEFEQVVTAVEPDAQTAQLLERFFWSAVVLTSTTAGTTTDRVLDDVEAHLRRA